MANFLENEYKNACVAARMLRVRHGCSKGQMANRNVAKNGYLRNEVEPTYRGFANIARKFLG
jgi:hypothetical protein